MTTFFALRGLLFAGEILAGSALLMAVAWLAAPRKTASTRHLTWAGAFAALLVFPALTAMMPTTIHIMLAAPPPAIPLTHLVYVADVAALPAPPPPAFSFDAPTIALLLLALWCAGACAVGLRFGIGAACLALLKRRSRPFAVAPSGLPRVEATRRECELRISGNETGPITWGLFRPVILLPKSATCWPRERLQAVLLHELAHIRRRDSLVQAISQLVCALYWPNPLVWMGAHALRREAEMAADDAVIASGVKPSSYAGELLQLASEFRGLAPSYASVPLSMAAPSALEARVRSVLSPTFSRSGVTSMDVLKIAGLALLTTSAFALACPSLAQDASAPPAPASVATPEAPPAPEPPPPPPAPPAEAVAPAAPTEAVPAAPAAAPSEHLIVDGRSERELTPAERKRIRIVIKKARHEAREALEKARPQIERAVAEAKVSRDEAMRAVRNVQPQIDAAMAEVEKARPQIEKSIAEAHVSEQAMRDAQPQIDAAMAEVARTRPEIDEALAKAQPEIDAALEKVRAELAKDHFDVRIEKRVDEALHRAEVRIEATKARMKDSASTRIEERSTVTTGTPGAEDAPEHD
jgi:beta-lactamase regulating signal transducer with metallopeptidase domain